MRRAAVGIGLLVVVLQVGMAAAAEPAPPQLFCEGAPPGPPKPAVPVSAPPAPHWRDLEVALLLSVGVAGAIAYVVRNERRRSGKGEGATAWTPYVAGASLGVVFALSLIAYGRPLGVSAGVQQAARLLTSMAGAGEGAPAPRSPGVLWPLWVLAGVAIGGASSAFLRARRGGTSSLAVPADRRGRTWLVAFGAGMLLQAAATIAGGCTSGLALSGGIVLSPAAFVFMAGMFIGGIPTAWVAAHLALRREGRTP
jgi:uncharacterized protein